MWQPKIYVLSKMTQFRLEISCELFVSVANMVYSRIAMNLIAVFKEK